MAEAPGLRSPKLPWHFVPTYRAELWASLFIVSLLLAVVLGACIVHVSRQNAALTARVSQLEDSLQRTDGRAVTDEAAIAAAVDREVIFRGEITGLERTVLQLIDQPAASTAGAVTLTLSPRQMLQLAKMLVQQLQPPSQSPVSTPLNNGGPQ